MITAALAYRFITTPETANTLQQEGRVEQLEARLHEVAILLREHQR